MLSEAGSSGTSVVVAEKLVEDPEVEDELLVGISSVNREPGEKTETLLGVVALEVVDTSNCTQSPSKETNNKIIVKNILLTC